MLRSLPYGLLIKKTVIIINQVGKKHLKNPNLTLEYRDGRRNIG